MDYGLMCRRISLGVGLMLSIPSLPAQMGGGMMGGGMGDMMEGMGGMCPRGMGGMMMDLPDLTPDQRTKIRAIEEDVRHRHWDTMGKLMDGRAKMRDLMDAEPRDPKAIGTHHEVVSKLERQMLEAHVDAENRMMSVLTPAQREQMQQMKRGGMGMMGGGKGKKGMGGMMQ